jgi:hypothetical protein
MAAPTVTIAAPDLAASFAKTQTDLTADVTALTAKGDADSLAIAAEKQKQVDALKGKVPPTIPYITDAPVRCRFPSCPSPDFTASFPGHQRTLVCPSCGSEVSVPDAFRWEEPA